MLYFPSKDIYNKSDELKGYKVKPDKQSIIEKYSKEGVTISCLAKEYNTHRVTVRNWLKEYNIPRKSQKQASIEANNRHRNFSFPSKEELQNNYEKMSIKDLEDYYKVSQSTIYLWLDKHHINIFFQKERVGQFIKKEFEDKNLVFSLYEETKNIQLLANKLNCSYSKAKETLYFYDIERYQKVRTSQGQDQIFQWLCEINPEGEWQSNDRSLINPQEIDIISYKHKIAIEYCGTYWHSQTWGNKPKSYHLNKLKAVQDCGFRLFTFFDFISFEKIQKFLINKIGLNKNKISARNTIFKEVLYKNIQEFEEKNHFGGSRYGDKHFALYDKNNNLLQSMSFGAPRFNSVYEWEMIRFTSGDINVIGGASKLFSNSLKLMTPKSLITYCDKRYGEGETYLKLGMKLNGSSEPNYWYFHKNKPHLIHSRVKFQKHKLSNLLENFDPEKTEYENMLSNKYDRFWDCGNNVYTYEEA